jgi:hypothetical protein
MAKWPIREIIPPLGVAGMKCRHCGKRVTQKGGAVYRILNSPRDVKGKKGYPELPIQGPLCPHCAELPPSRMPWRRGPR